MKFTLPLLACASFATVAHAADRAESKRALDIIGGAFANISDYTTVLQTSIANFSGLSDVGPTVAASLNVITAIQVGVNNTLAGPNVNGMDALLLAPPIIDLRAVVSDSIKAIIDKKPAFVKLSTGVAGIVYTQIQTLNCESTRLLNATKRHIPGGGIAYVADRVSEPIFESFKTGLAAYQDVAPVTAASFKCSYVNSTSLKGVPHAEGAATSLSASTFGMVGAALAAIAVML